MSIIIIPNNIMINTSKTIFKFAESKLSKPFTSIRVYKELSNLELLNALMVNRAANTNWLIAHSMRMYNLSSTLFTKTLTNWIIKNTFGRVFTAGETTKDVTSMMDLFQKMNIPVILDYSGEGFIDKRAIESELDKNAKMFQKTAEVASKYKDQMISVKYTALVDVPTLRKLNIGRRTLYDLWQKYSVDGRMNGVQLLRALQNLDGSVSQQDVAKFVEEIFNKPGDLRNFQCDEVQFLMNIHPYYIFETTKNSNKIIKLIANISKQENARIQNFIRRVNTIFQKFYDNPQNLRITVDAEQSYVQDAINSLTEQYQAKYNTKNAFIIPTFQNYLKNAKSRMDYEIQIAHRRNLYFGSKHVRGAYLVEQRKLAEQKKYQCPIVQTFDQTTQNYNRNVSLGLNDPRVKASSQMIIATHNQETIQEIQEMLRKKKNQSKLYFAQLQGLADHLTIQLSKQGYQVYKYLPYGNTDIIVPYLIRRAQQLSQMRYPLTLQYELIVDEFRNRMGLNS